VILEHSVLGLHTCLVPVLLSSPLLSCIPCLGSALQYILLSYNPLSRALYLNSFPCVHHVHLDSSIAPLYLLRYSTADPLNSLSTFRANPPTVHVGHYGQPTVTPFIPNPSLDLPPAQPRLPVQRSVPAQRVERFNLNRAQATALAASILDALEVNEDATAIPLPYDFGDKISRIVAEGLGLEQAVIAEGLGVRCRGGRGQG
jgi:hypothetical protein